MTPPDSFPAKSGNSSSREWSGGDNDDDDDGPRHENECICLSGFDGFSSAEEEMWKSDGEVGVGAVLSFGRKDKRYL